jgi:D-hexose-6-phosphate mutarotase
MAAATLLESRFMTKQTERQTEDPSHSRIMVLDGQGELTMLRVTTPWSTAEIYQHGAHVTNFTTRNEPPLLFMSQCSRFTEGQPIRGGIPVIFPWFGPREGMAQHGFARVKAWDAKELVSTPEGSVSVRFRLPDCPEASSFPAFTADYIVTVSQDLTLQLLVTNQSQDEPLTFENCLHTYFAVGDITAVSITGLKGAEYLDKVANFARKTENNDAIRIGSEVDRVYLNTTSPVEIHDSRLSRKIRIEKQNSLSTVVWNPWIAKAQQMPDFGNDEYQRMLCVESGNVSSNQIVLPPGETSTLTVKITSETLAKGG